MPDLASAMCSRVLAENHRRIDALLRRLVAREGAPSVLLDVGCWDGAATVACARAIGAGRVLGVEVYAGPARAAAGRGVEVESVDLERDRLPWEEGSVDLVVCNQVLEHLKDIWLALGEMHRVLRLGGHAVLSVPNLSSLHNRVLLALGRQPTSIRVFGPHVRGYAFREFERLVAHRGAFEIEAREGVGFYPLPPPLSRPLSAIWPGGSHTVLLLARKAGERNVWGEHLREQLSGGVQTFYGEAAAFGPAVGAARGSDAGG